MKQLLLSFTLIGAGFTTAYSQSNIPNIKNHFVEQSLIGDLNKDGVDDLVVVYQQNEAEDEMDNKSRRLITYQKKGGNWVKWSESTTAIMGTQEGGMMGDPFANIEIKNGILIISHYGGSGWKWGIEDKYRYQNNDFYLIGYTSTYGQVGNEWTSVDFNLSTGQINYEKTTNEGSSNEKTIKETFTKKGIKITMKNRTSDAEGIIITSPKYKAEITL